MLRNNSMVLSHNILGLYPYHCFSLLSLSYDVVLQTMCVKLDMITDIEMVTMIKEILNILIVDV